MTHTTTDNRKPARGSLSSATGRKNSAATTAGKDPASATRSKNSAAATSRRVSRNDLLLAAIAGALAMVWLLAWVGRTPESLAWTFLRLSGVAGYALLGLSVALGALTSSRFIPAWLAKPLQFGWHGLLSGAALALVVVHGAFSLVDATYPQTAAGVLVPGLATYAPVALALGTLAFYAMTTVYVSYGLRTRVPARWTKRLHLLAYPAFILGTLHGVMAGSDRLTWLYGLTLMVVAMATAVRLLERRGPKRAPATGTPK